MELLYTRCATLSRNIPMLYSPYSVRCKRRRGMVAVYVALSMTVLLGISAIALDGGILLAERRHAQATADAAALAAAAELFKNSSGTASQSAASVAKANGYANDGTNSV